MAALTPIAHLVQIDAAGKNWAAAAQHCRAALATNTDCLQARDLCAAVLRQVGRGEEAAELLRGTRALDPLDWWAAHLEGGQAALRCDTQTALDLSLDYAGAGEPANFAASLLHCSYLYV